MEPHLQWNPPIAKLNTFFHNQSSIKQIIMLKLPEIRSKYPIDTADAVMRLKNLLLFLSQKITIFVKNSSYSALKNHYPAK